MPYGVDRVGLRNRRRSKGLGLYKLSYDEPICECSQPVASHYLGKKFCQNCRQWIVTNGEDHPRSF